MHQTSLDHGKHCKCAVGSHVQAHDEPDPKNTQQARTRDCVCLRPASSAQGGHELLDSHSKRVVTGSDATEAPIAPAVIAIVEGMAKKDGVKGLKIKTKTGRVLFDSSWLAGVDYQHQTEAETEELEQQHAEDTEEEDSDMKKMSTQP